MLIGAFVGALFAGKLSDHFGRRPAKLITAAIFIVGILITTFANSLTTFTLGRFITGWGVGLTSVIAPLYLAEISSPEKRGFVVGLNQLMLTIGVLVAYLVNFAFSASGQWRWMFALGMIPAFVQLISFSFIEETAAWKEKNTKDLHWKNILLPKYRFLIVVGMILSALQQLTGINAIVYFAPEIFSKAGFSSLSVSLMATIGLGIMGVLSTILSMSLIDKIGRKKLLLIGITGNAVSLFILALAFFTHSTYMPAISILTLFGFMIFFGIGLGPVLWVVLSEIYPLQIRGAAMSLAVFVNWVCNTIVAFTFLDLLIFLGAGQTFIIYSIIGILGWFFIYRYLPETKGKHLET